MMNGAVLRIGDFDALQLCLLALGIAFAVMAVPCAIQGLRGRGSGAVLGWVGMALAGLVAATLILTGLP